MTKDTIEWFIPLLSILMAFCVMFGINIYMWIIKQEILLWNRLKRWWYQRKLDRIIRQKLKVRGITKNCKKRFVFF